MPFDLCVCFWGVIKNAAPSKLTDILEDPGVVPYPDDGNEATDHRRPSPRQLLIRLIGTTNGKCIWLGELMRGESIGLAEIGECDRGDAEAATTEAACPTKLRRWIATTALRDGSAIDFFVPSPSSFCVLKNPDNICAKSLGKFGYWTLTILADRDGADLPSVEFRTRTIFEILSKPLFERNECECCVW